MKKKKVDLKKDTVNSKHFHVGIELELKAVGDNCDGDHDEDSCFEARQESQRDYLESMSNRELLRDYVGVDRAAADAVANYFDASQWVNDYMSDWSDDGCDNDDCRFRSANGEQVRDEMENELQELVENNSIKVVSDSSIETSDGEVDAEVCWNYFASKETLKDNSKIIDYLTKRDCKFDSTCGLHINLNNYLNIPKTHRIDTNRLEFLFNFVADSRKSSSYCNRNGMSGNEKYSMIYNQGDRLEFRFFSPTLNAEKLNHYVTLANTVYRRLAGVNCKLPKKTSEYFLEKMIDTNNRSRDQALNAIERVNSLPDSYELSGNKRPIPPEVNETLINVSVHIPTMGELTTIRMSECVENHQGDCLCLRGGEIMLPESEESEACRYV